MGCEYYQRCIKYSVTMSTENVSDCHNKDYIFNCSERKRLIEKEMLDKIETERGKR